MPFQYDAAEASDRLTALLALEIVSLLHPSLWGTQRREFIAQSIVINWAFRCQLLKTMEYVTLLLVTFFFPSKNFRGQVRVEIDISSIPSNVWLICTDILGQSMTIPGCRAVVDS